MAVGQGDHSPRIQCTFRSWLKFTAMRYCLLFCLVFAFAPVFSQKMVLLERANRAKTTKLFVGETITYSLNGDERYWYQRTITSILPESNMLLLDNFPVKLTDIAAMRVRRPPVLRWVGTTIFTFGASLAVATIGAALFQDKSTQYGLLAGCSVASMGGGLAMNSRKVLKMGDKHRLRIIEINFAAPQSRAGQ